MLHSRSASLLCTITRSLHRLIQVFLNGKRVPVNNFQQYIDLYLGPKLAAGRCVTNKPTLVHGEESSMYDYVRDELSQFAAGHREGF